MSVAGETAFTEAKLQGLNAASSNTSMLRSKQPRLCCRGQQTACSLYGENAAVAHLCQQRCARDVATICLELACQESQRGGNCINVIFPLGGVLRASVRADQ